MKQKTTDAPVTKKELKTILNDYPTKKDLKEVLKAYPTKDYFSETLTKSFEAFRQENAYQFQLMREELHNDFLKFTSRILTVIDPLLAELETRQQDRELQTAHIKKIRADIRDLDRRVTNLEHSQ